MKNHEDKFGIWLVRFIFLLVILFFIMISFCHSNQTTASWYSVESCQREGTTGIMANGKRLNDDHYTAASWDYDFGTRIEVTNLKNGKTVICEVTDRGPNRRLYSNGRILDLSKAAFSAIADLREGVIPIKITEVQ